MGTTKLCLRYKQVGTLYLVTHYLAWLKDSYGVVEVSQSAICTAHSLPALMWILAFHFFSFSMKSLKPPPRVDNKIFYNVFIPVEQNANICKLINW